MAYKRKTRDVYVVEQFTASGWELVTSSMKRKEARDNVKDYEKNQPEYPVRMRKTREPIFHNLN